MAGPLDAWLQRRPLQPVQPQQHSAQQEQQSEDGIEQQEERSQQTAQPASSEQEQQPPTGVPAKNTLLAFLVKRDSSSLLADDQPQRKRRHTLRCAQDWQLTGRMGAGGAAALRHRHAAAYRQLAALESHAWQRPVLLWQSFRRLGRQQMSPAEAGSIQCAQFDSLGELLVAGSEHGLLTVHTTAQLLAAARPAGAAAAAAAAAAAGAGAGGVQASQPPRAAAQQAVGTADPLLVLDSHMASLQAVRWNGADENVVGAASAATRQLHLYDLQHTQGEPKQVLSVPQQTALAIGLTDLAFFGAGSGCSSGSGGSSGGGGGYLVLASGMGGQVFLWDARAKAAPSATLAASGSGAIYAAQLAPDEQVVVAGTQSGELKLWDLRGGSSSTLRFGGTVHHHPLLAAFNIRFALTGVPGLASQTAIPASAVHSLQLDPCDPRRAAFHLGCGWSGVLELGSGSVTHLHAPAHLYTDEAAAGGASQEGGGAAGPGAAAQAPPSHSAAAPWLHRRACWARDGRRFCVPSRRDDTLLLLDFAPTPAAGCYALHEEEQPEQAHLGASGDGSGFVRSSSLGGARERPRVPPAAAVELSQAAICTAAHPTLDVLVVGGLGSRLSVAGLA